MASKKNQYHGDRFIPSRRGCESSLKFRFGEEATWAQVQTEAPSSSRNNNLSKSLPSSKKPLSNTNTNTMVTTTQGAKPSASKSSLSSLSSSIASLSSSTS